MNKDFDMDVSPFPPWINAFVLSKKGFLSLPAINLNEIAKNTSESFTVLRMTATDENDLTSALKQYWVGPIWDPVTARGTDIEPTDTASQRIPNPIWIIRFLWKTAWTRK